MWAYVGLCGPTWVIQRNRIRLEVLKSISKSVNFPPFILSQSFVNKLNPVNNSLHKRLFLIGSSALLLIFPGGLFPSGCPTETVYAVIFYPMRATHPTHFVPPLHISKDLSWALCKVIPYSEPFVPQCFICPSNGQPCSNEVAGSISTRTPAAVTFFLVLLSTSRQMSC
jgi:hypothetical protein